MSFINTNINLNFLLNSLNLAILDAFLLKNTLLKRDYSSANLYTLALNRAHLKSLGLGSISVWTTAPLECV